MADDLITYERRGAVGILYRHRTTGTASRQQADIHAEFRRTDRVARAQVRLDAPVARRLPALELLVEEPERDRHRGQGVLDLVSESARETSEEGQPVLVAFVHGWVRCDVDRRDGMPRRRDDSHIAVRTF